MAPPSPDTALSDKSKAQGESKTAPISDEDDESLLPKFSPEEEKQMVEESNSAKVAANTLFSTKRYEAAILKYDEAVAVCPNYLDYELAVLQSNISACHLKLEQWKEAMSSATSAIDKLDKIEKEATTVPASAPSDSPGPNANGHGADSDEEIEDEIISSGAARAAPAPKPSSESPEELAHRQRKDNVARIRAKALMRRARARSELGGWQNLAGAEEDYKLLSTMSNLAAADKKIIQTQLRLLPPRTKAAQEKETAEMWGKLKDLGNGLLKPFGLSTDNFNLVKDEKTGGYSMNFQQGSPSSS